MAKRNQSLDFFQNVSKISEQMQAKDTEVSVRRSGERGELNALPLAQIRERKSDTRALNKNHVSGLLESISILGLIEPLAVDQEKVLLAGGHRLAAIKLLQTDELEIFQRQFPDALIPVRVMPFKSTSDAEKALQIEIAENEHRRDYTPAEVKKLAHRLRQAGYREGGGRPKAGEKLLMPALSVVIGKHKRTIQRYLYESDTKTQTDVSVYLKRAKKALHTWQQQISSNDTNEELLEQLPALLMLIDQTLEKELSAA